jgi:hypothetical protein
MSAEELLAEGLVEGDDYDDYGDLLYDSCDIDLSDSALPEKYHHFFGIPKPAPVPRVNVDDGDDDDEIKF